MAVVPASVAVGTTATLLSGTDPGQAGTGSPDGMSILVRPAAAVFLGGAGVTATAAGGYEVAAGSELSFDLAPGDALYAIAAAGTVTVAVLRTGV